MLYSLAAALLLGRALAVDRLLGFNAKPLVENRTIDEIYKAALAEGGVVTLWHGGDETNQRDSLKEAFEKQFPGMTLNLTVDLSKYLDGKIDEQVACGNVTVDSVMLQTTHDFTRWAQHGVLLNYAPNNFDKIRPAFKDSTSASYYGTEILWLSNVWNTKKLPDANFDTFQEFLKPEYKDRIVLAYPNDDDAILYAFDIIMQQHGTAWFDKLLAQNPRWVRGTQTPATLLLNDTEDVAVTFTTIVGFDPIENANQTFPTDGQFVSWAQTGGILADAPHPEGAKLLHNWILSDDYQKSLGWSVRGDIPRPEGVPDMMSLPTTNTPDFPRWMQDRSKVERLRFWFENKLGTAQGLSPLKDNM
ncbi:ABC-type Fe3+ transport system [Purpureocillium lilacinum]|nr:ABC-type Fe3+ transport system [Purpureocillium lilacinum]